MSANQIVMAGLHDSGTLPSATSVERACSNGFPLPATITLKSADAGRKIELSSDGGVEYITPAYDTTTSTMLIVVVTAPISHIRFTGAAAGTDTWSVR